MANAEEGECDELLLPERRHPTKRDGAQLRQQTSRPWGVRAKIPCTKRPVVRILAAAILFIGVVFVIKKLMAPQKTCYAWDRLKTRTAKPLKIYMYELPEAFRAEAIAAKYTTPDYLNDPNWMPTNCDLAKSVCRETVWRKEYSTMRQYAADMTIIEKFKHYKHRVWDPAEADIFVVPYPHSADCRAPPRNHWTNCPVHEPGVQEMVRGLAHFAAHKERHLFLLTGDMGNNLQFLERMPLYVSLGGRRAPSMRTTNIIVPPPVLEPEYQPSELAKVNWTRARKFSLYMNAGLVSSERRMIDFILKRTEMVGGLPTIQTAIENHRSFKLPPSKVWENYRNTLFCPVVKGDRPYQKRFFDVALSGCLPVVLVSPSQDSCRTNCYSWFKTNGLSWSETHPFASNGPQLQKGFSVNYQEFVVEVFGGAANLLPTLEALMRNKTKLRAMQQALGKYARALVYGLGKDMHAEGDAFDQILGQLQDHLDRRKCGFRPRPTVCNANLGCVGLNYVVNDPMARCSPQSVLKSFDECEAARKDLDGCTKVTKYIDSDQVPRGCFVSQMAWYFNKAEEPTQLNNWTEPVCKFISCRGH